LFEPDARTNDCRKSKHSKADRSDDSAERSGAGGIGRVISNGKNNMPPFQGELKSLNPDQIHDLVIHLRQWGQNK
jgi:hypothetical protein